MLVTSICFTALTTFILQRENSRMLIASHTFWSCITLSKKTVLLTVIYNALCNLLLQWACKKHLFNLEFGDCWALTNLCGKAEILLLLKRHIPLSILEQIVSVCNLNICHFLHKLNLLITVLISIYENKVFMMTHIYLNLFSKYSIIISHFLFYRRWTI